MLFVNKYTSIIHSRIKFQNFGKELKIVRVYFDSFKQIVTKSTLMEKISK
jgi:hypothetical protein